MREGEGGGGEEEVGGCVGGGTVRGTSVGASSLSFSDSCSQKRWLRCEACR